MMDDKKEKLERVAKRMEAFASEVKPAERLCLKLSVAASAAWVVMIFIFSLEMSSIVLIASVFLFGMHALLRMIRIDILSILNDLNELL